MRVNQKDLEKMDLSEVKALMKQFNTEVYRKFKKGNNGDELEIYDKNGEITTKLRGWSAGAWKSGWAITAQDFLTEEEWHEDIINGLVPEWKYENGEYICTGY